MMYGLVVVVLLLCCCVCVRVFVFFAGGLLRDVVRYELCCAVVLCACL